KFMASPDRSIRGLVCVGMRRPADVGLQLGAEHPCSDSDVEYGAAAGQELSLIDESRIVIPACGSQEHQGGPFFVGQTATANRALGCHERELAAPLGADCVEQFYCVAHE